MRSTFDPSTSIFAGMSTDVLQTTLNNAQTAYANLMMGSKGEVFSYTQGDGAKSVTYTRTNAGQLMMLIKQLQSCLGTIPTPRRAILPVF